MVNKGSTHVGSHCDPVGEERRVTREGGDVPNASCARQGVVLAPHHAHPIAPSSGAVRSAAGVIGGGQPQGVQPFAVGKFHDALHVPRPPPASGDPKGDVAGTHVCAPPSEATPAGARAGVDLLSHGGEAARDRRGAAVRAIALQLLPVVTQTILSHGNPERVDGTELRKVATLQYLVHDRLGAPVFKDAHGHIARVWVTEEPRLAARNPSPATVAPDLHPKALHVAVHDIIKESVVLPSEHIVRLVVVAVIDNAVVVVLVIVNDLVVGPLEHDIVDVIVALGIVVAVVHLGAVVLNFALRIGIVAHFIVIVVALIFFVAAIAHHVVFVAHAVVREPHLPGVLVGALAGVVF
mmetsp:Transcript_12383/g.25313  ORF Transcript_12383/g.25313 Transcript_12383/m.25313 type:complete len:352 (-) Transcript_12383:1397-2452(-)